MILLPVEQVLFSKKEGERKSNMAIDVFLDSLRLGKTNDKLTSADSLCFCDKVLPVLLNTLKRVSLSTIYKL